MFGILTQKSINSKLSLLAEELGIEKKEDIVDKLLLQLKSNKISKNMLFLFDNIESKQEMDYYYIDNPNIKFLITSRSQSWNNILQIKPLSIDASIKYLEHHLKTENKNELKKLAERINGWALGLKESVAMIKKSYTISNFLKDYNEFLTSTDLISKTVTERLEMLSDEANILVDVIGWCNPKNIPERMLKKIIVENKGTGIWLRARGELVNYFIVSVDEDSQL